MARKPKTPKPLTSTSAFRAYLRVIDYVAGEVEAGRISTDDAQEQQRELASLLSTQLGRLFRQRLVQASVDRADDLTIETYPVPHLRDLAEGTSYVHRAHFPPADQGGPAAGPADSSEVSEDRPAGPRPWQRPFDPELDE
jgi:hypothetical protein